LSKLAKMSCGFLVTPQDKLRGRDEIASYNCYIHFKIILLLFGMLTAYNSVNFYHQPECKMPHIKWSKE